MASIGSNKCPMMARDYFSRHAWICFVSHIYDVESDSEKLLADLRVEGTPSEVVVIVRSNDAGEFMEVKFENLF